MKPLNELSTHELWRLFPIELKEYNPEWAEWYAAAASPLMAVRDVERVTHIGSTSVPGLLSKPIVDILLEVRGDADTAQLQRQLEELGFFYLPPTGTNEPFTLPGMFAKGYTPQGFARQVYHVHVRVSGHYDEPYFCAYLRNHPEVARDYAELKQSLVPRYRENRDGYTQEKTEFIEKITARARKEGGQ